MRASLGIFLLLLSSLHAAAAGLSDLRAARSLIGEAALVLRLDAQHRLTSQYALQSQAMIREQLQSELQNFGGRSQEGKLVRAALVVLDRRDQHGLKQTQAQLTRLVEGREQPD